MLICFVQLKEPKKLSLKDASEGYIGKLQILRSGKARYGKIINVSVLVVILTHSLSLVILWHASIPQASSPLSSVTILQYRPTLPARGRVGVYVARVSNCFPLEEATSFPGCFSPRPSPSLLSLLSAERERSLERGCVRRSWVVHLVYISHYLCSHSISRSPKFLFVFFFSSIKE